MNTDLNIC